MCRMQTKMSAAVSLYLSVMNDRLLSDGSLQLVLTIICRLAMDTDDSDKSVIVVTASHAQHQPQLFSFSH